MHLAFKIYVPKAKTKTILYNLAAQITPLNIKRSFNTKALSTIGMLPFEVFLD
jgi:hypothetical protein